jgi:hypothetical protein
VPTGFVGKVTLSMLLHRFRTSAKSTSPSGHVRRKNLKRGFGITSSPRRRSIRFAKGMAIISMNLFATKSPSLVVMSRKIISASAKKKPRASRAISMF